MKDSICYIVGAGENYGLDFLPQSGDFVIAADGGFSFLQKANINADLIIGDFDSLPALPAHANVIALNTEKDDTDMLAAIRAGMDKAYQTFYIYCGTGGRIDHTLANIQALTFLSRHNKNGYLFGHDFVITAVTNGSVSFSSRCKGCVSVFSGSDQAAGVCLTGLKYALHNAVLSNAYPIGVSNAFTGAKSTVSVADGTLLITFPREFIKEVTR